MARTVRRYTNEEKAQAWRLRRQGLSTREISVWMHIDIRVIDRFFSRPSPILPEVKPPTWVDEALCTQTDPEAFFPEDSTGTSAIAVCQRCTVKDECLQWALDRDEVYGIWGGTTAKERKRLKKLWQTK